ncbi:MAG: NAD(P)H-dependent oxidoreductase subunit E [Bdellovibrionales bacterium]
MYNKKPVGKLHVQVCTNISCSMNGGRELADHLCLLNIGKFDEVSSDRRNTQLVKSSAWDLVTQPL